MDEKDFKKFAIIILVSALLVLTFIMLRPIAVSIFFGAVLSYIFRPLYGIINKRIKSKNLSALIIVLGVILILLVPLIFLVPLAARQVVDSYVFLKSQDLTPVLINAFPNLFDSPTTAADISAIASSFVSKTANFFLSMFGEWIFNLPNILLQAAIVLFSFFFLLRDFDLMKMYILSIAPFHKDYQKRIYEQFKQITTSVIYGEIIVGIIQGLVAGFGYLIFGIHNALLLTLFTIIAAIIPIIGAWLIWVPVDIYLFLTGHTNQAIGLLIYSILIVSWIDNIIRPLIVARLAKVNTGIVLIGMIGGLYVFGILGLLIGPLLLSYLLLLAEFYKERTFKSILIQEPPKETKPAA